MMENSALKRTTPIEQPGTSKKSKLLDTSKLSSAFTNVYNLALHSRVESTPFDLSKLMPTDDPSHQEQISNDVPETDKPLFHIPSLPRHPSQRTSLKLSRTQLNLETTSSRSFPLKGHVDPLIVLKNIINDDPTSTDPLLPLYNKHPKLRPYFPASKNFDQNPDYTRNTSSVIQHTAEVAQSTQVPKSSVNLNQLLPNKDTGAKATLEASSCDFGVNASVNCDNPVKLHDSVQPMSSCGHHQGTGLAEFAVDESIETCVEEIPSDQSEENEYETQLLLDTEGSSMEGPPIDRTTTDDTLYVEDDDNNEQSGEMITEETPMKQKLADKVDKPESITEMVDTWTNQLTDILDKMKFASLDTCKVSHDLHTLFVRSATAIENMSDAWKNIQKSRNDVASVIPQPAEASEEKQDEVIEKSNKESREDGDDNPKDANKDGSEEKSSDDDDNEDDKNKESPKKVRAVIRSFVLPPEYDPDDSTWTVKYPKNDPKDNLVELMPKTKVYINSLRLSHAKRVSKDSKMLARMLLTEVFTQSALSVCSLTGAKANAFSSEKVRPGLDENARMALMSFVEKHNRKKDWGVFDSQAVTNSIRSKIQEIRAKYGQTT